MSPEFLMEESSKIESEISLKPESPKRNGIGHWSAFEMQEWKKKIEDAFDHMAHPMGFKSSERQQSVPQPKLNGEARLDRLEGDLEKAIKVKEGELEAGRQEPLGYGPVANRAKPPLKPSEA